MGGGNETAGDERRRPGLYSAPLSRYYEDIPEVPQCFDKTVLSR